MIPQPGHSIPLRTAPSMTVPSQAPVGDDEPDAKYPRYDEPASGRAGWLLTGLVGQFRVPKHGGVRYTQSLWLVVVLFAEFIFLEKLNITVVSPSIFSVYRHLFPSE